MERIAVLNNVHATGFRTMARMLNDFGFRCFSAGRSFQSAVMAHTGGVSWGDRCDGVMEAKAMPPGALFVDAYPHTEARFRRAGFPNPLLVFWIEPRGPEALTSWRPGAGTAVLAQCPRVGKALAETKILSSFFWAPYPDGLERARRESFGPEVVTVLHNAAGWSAKAVDSARKGGFPFALYGSPPPHWAVKLAHEEVVRRIRAARCLFHPKPFDAPGYALLEAVFQGVPVVLTPTFVRKTGADDVWEDGNTCLLIRDTTVPTIKAAVERLADPAENARIGRAAQARLESLADWPANRAKLERLLAGIGALK